LKSERSWWRSPWLSIRAQVGLGAIFAAAAVPKILDPPAFAHMVYNYRLLPGSAVNAAALVLPWIEIGLGVALILGFWKRTAAGWAGILLLAFMGALAVNLARGNPVNCGCFNLHAKDRPRAELLAEMRWTIVRDAGILLLVAQVLSANPRQRRLPG
jgi:putative oxidoreductase